MFVSKTTDISAAVKAQRRKEARPAEILDAGLKEFAEHGFAASKLVDIARRAGVVKGTLYRYFPNKEALFEAAVTSRVNPMFDQVNTLLDHYPGSTEDLLRIALPQIYQRIFNTDLHILMRIIISESNRFPDIAQFYHQQVILKGRGLLEKIVQRGIERGEFRDGPVTDTPMVIFAPVLMTVVWKMTFDRFDPIDIEKMAAAHVDMVFNGIKVSAKK